MFQGSPTRVAIGTDLFEIMVSGAYGAFTYALKGRVELIAAVVMLIGAAIGAQFGTHATQYVKGLKIRLYFAITMALAGVSVILKIMGASQIAGYSMLLTACALSGLIIVKMVEGIINDKRSIIKGGVQ